MRLPIFLILGGILFFAISVMAGGPGDLVVNKVEVVMPKAGSYATGTIYVSGLDQEDAKKYKNFRVSYRIRCIGNVNGSKGYDTRGDDHYVTIKASAADRIRGLVRFDAEVYYQLKGKFWMTVHLSYEDEKGQKIRTPNEGHEISSNEFSTN